MKKLNKKGFTLVELLVVIVILVVIMAIAVPSITSSVERSKEKEKQTKIELIKSYAKIYSDAKGIDNLYREVEYKITIGDLYCAGLLTQEEAKDPFSEDRTLSGYISFDGFNYHWINCDICYLDIKPKETFNSKDYCES